MIAIDTRDFCIPSDENDYDELVAFADTIAGIQTYEVIPVDVLDKIRAEITEKKMKMHDAMMRVFAQECIDIIDKYRNEVNE